MIDQLISEKTAILIMEKNLDFGSTFWLKGWGTFPTQSGLQAWLRKTHNIHIVIKPFYDSLLEKISYAGDVMQIGTLIAKNKRLIAENEYEDMLETCLQEGLDMISENRQHLDGIVTSRFLSDATTITQSTIIPQEILELEEIKENVSIKISYPSTKEKPNHYAEITAAGKHICLSYVGEDKVIHNVHY